MKLQPAMVFSSHMVLQRQQSIPVWGKAACGDTVYITFDGEQAVVPVVNGAWHAKLRAREAATGLTMTISTELTAEQIVFQDICVGEVWLAGGQSNMQFELRYDAEAAQVLPEADDPLLRFFDYPEVTMPGQVEYGRTEEYGFWRRTTPADARYFSAVGYYFARALRAALNVPVGILGCNYGGTAANAWTAPEDLKAVPELKAIVDEFEDSLNGLDWRKDERMQIKRAQADPRGKRRMDDEILMGRFENMMALFAAMSEGDDAPPVMQNSPKQANSPSTLYEYMLKPCAPYGIRGVIWYQGETDNRPYAIHYDKSLKAMRKSWNRLWKRELPIYQVMLAPFEHWGPLPNLDSYPIRVIRELQLRLAQDEPGFYCANIMDSGAIDNIHPRCKRPAGERLALLARKYTYGEDILADSPTLSEIAWEAGRVTVHFQNAGERLSVKGEAVQALTLRVGGEAVPFAAHIEGDALVVESPALTDGCAAALEFAQENYCEVNLYGATGLPVFPFSGAHRY